MKCLHKEYKRIKCVFYYFYKIQALPALPCFNILRRARDDMYTCSAVSTAGVSEGGAPEI